MAGKLSKRNSYLKPTGFPDWGLDHRLTTLLHKNIHVTDITIEVLTLLDVTGSQSQDTRLV